KAYRREVVRLVDAGRFDEVARVSAALLHEVEASEARDGCSFAMTRHVVEQVGYAALNALTWRAQSQGQTDPMARDLVRKLRIGTNTSASLDRMAQTSHALGAGILVNDVPEIPL